MTLKQNIHHWLLMTWMIFIVIGLSLSPVLMSIGTIGMTIQWLYDLIRKEIKPWVFITFSTTRNWVILYVLLLLAMTWSSNWNFGINDLRIKLPLLLLSITLPSYLIDLKKEKRRIIEWTFIFGIVVSAIVSILLVHDAMPLSHWVVSKKLSPSQIREYSVFTSHVRMGLFSALGIALLWSYPFHQWWKTLMRFGLSLFLIYYLVLIESATGIFLVAVTGLFFVVRYLKLRFSYRYKIWTLSTLGVFLICSLAYVTHLFKNYNTIQPNQTALYKTSDGNEYSSNWNNLQIENGYLVHLNICEKELIAGWNQRSAIDYNQKDLSGGDIHQTLIRYISSMGKPKDLLSVKALSDEQIREIEMGIPNCRYTQMNGFERRFDKLFFEYQMIKLGDAPNGYSLFQRFIYWQNAIHLIGENWLLGTGTGDLNDAIKENYRSNNHGLLEKYQLRTHNQYLTIILTLGILGLIFCIVFLYNIIKAAKRCSLIASIYVMIILFSMITEDTLETQAGITFIAFFSAWWLGAPLWSSEKWRPRLA
jgi:O-Antigen ligase